MSGLTIRATQEGRVRIVESDAGFAERYATVLLDMLQVAPDDPDYAAKEAAATIALSQALELVESYLDRKLDYLAEESEEFTGLRGRMLLRRYPVEAIASVAGDFHTLPPTGYVCDRAAGVLYLPGSMCGPVTTVRYAGGYKPNQWPLDLLNVILQLAASLWPAIYKTGTLAPATDKGAVRRVTDPDLGTVEYFEGGGASSSVLGFGAIPQGYLAVLDRYRAASIIGGA